MDCAVAWDRVIINMRAAESISVMQRPIVPVLLDAIINLMGPSFLTGGRF
jgi:hypothetical protein